jgi:hypothetical protein
LNGPACQAGHGFVSGGYFSPSAEIGSRYHLTPLAAITASGINTALWVQSLLEVRALEGRFHSPAFCDLHGALVLPADMELHLLDKLQVVQQNHPTLIPAEIIVSEKYGISRSFRRGATSEVRATGGVPSNMPKATDLAKKFRIITLISACLSPLFSGFPRLCKAELRGGLLVLVKSLYDLGWQVFIKALHVWVSRGGSTR